MPTKDTSMVISRWGLLIAIILLYGCNTEISTIGAYLKAHNNPKYGLIKQKDVQGIQIKVKYLPTDYLIYNEIKQNAEIASAETVDSLRKIYENTLNFVMVLGPSEGEDFDITKVGVSNYEAFNERIMAMSFEMQEQIQLKVGAQTYYPDIAQLERLFGLEKNVV